MRFDCDWSSDVCSSDLARIRRGAPALFAALLLRGLRALGAGRRALPARVAEPAASRAPRSEERRVGKECMSRGSAEVQKDRYVEDCLPRYVVNLIDRQS